MQSMSSSLARPSGVVSARRLPRVSDSLPKAPSWPAMPAGLSWRRKVRTFWKELELHVRLGFVGAWRGFVDASGVIAVSRLYATHIHADGRVEELGLISTKLVTDTGVAFLVDDWDNSVTDLTTMNFHACGTGVGAEAAADTALGTESTTILNPDSTRATGSRSQPAANQYRSVGTLTFDGSGAITEHGLCSAATSTYVLWDRSVFSAINVVNLDSIQFTYTCTVSSGG